jgi:hypothetical protein
MREFQVFYVRNGWIGIASVRTPTMLDVRGEMSHRIPDADIRTIREIGA